MSDKQVWCDREDPSMLRYFVATEAEMTGAWIKTIDPPVSLESLEAVSPEYIINFGIFAEDIPDLPAWCFTFMGEEPRIFAPTASWTGGQSGRSWPSANGRFVPLALGRSRSRMNGAWIGRSIALQRRPTDDHRS